MTRQLMHLKFVQTCYDEEELRRLVATRGYSVVCRESTQPTLFTVYEPVTPEEADTVIELDPMTELRTDSFDLAVYALYRPNTAVRFNSDFLVAVVFDYIARKTAQKSRPAPSEA
jgi:hypothetical protein